MTHLFQRQLFEPETSTYTYLLADPVTKDAILIDPVLSQVERDLKLIAELGFTLRYVLETHIHADHITGAGELRKRTGAQTVSGKHGAACTDRQLQHGEVLVVGGLEIKLLATPGHTDDSSSYLVADRLFSGDALLIRGTGRTDFQNGDSRALYESITRVLFALPDETRVFPGHDYHGMTESSIGEERRFNPRLAGKSVQDFVQLMSELRLARPKYIDVAVPANRVCGEVMSA